MCGQHDIWLAGETGHPGAEWRLGLVSREPEYEVPTDYLEASTYSTNNMPANIGRYYRWSQATAERDRYRRLAQVQMNPALGRMRWLDLALPTSKSNSNMLTESPHEKRVSGRG
jgi:hypothetical protein